MAVNKVALGVQFLCLCIEIVIICLVIYVGSSIDSETLFGYYHSIFQWHPILMVFAFILWMTQSLTVYHWLPLENKTVTRLVHAFFGILFLCFCVCGIAVIVRSKTQVDDVHFEEAHERIGLALFVMILIQVLIGIVKLTGILALDKKFMRWHGRMGQIIFAVALVTIATGVALTAEGYPDGYEDEVAIKDSGSGSYDPAIANYHNKAPFAYAIYCLLAVLAPFILFFDFFAALGADEDDDKYAGK